MMCKGTKNIQFGNKREAKSEKITNFANQSPLNHMEQDEFISIAEFARRAGVTPQAVYKQLNNQVDNRLSTYVKVHNGKKRISTKALELFLSTGINQVDNQVDNRFNNQFNNFSQPVDNHNDTRKDEIIALLKEQVADQKEQIEQLQSDLRASREDLARLATQMAKIADQGQQLQLKMLPGGQQPTQQPEEPGAAASPIQDAEVIQDAEEVKEEAAPTEQPVQAGQAPGAAAREVVEEGTIDELLDNPPSHVNWWMVVAIVAIIVLIAVGFFVFWNLTI